MPIVKNFSDLDLSKTHHYSDYLLWQFQERVKPIKIKKKSPAPNRNHPQLTVPLTFGFDTYFYNNPCPYYPAPFDVRLSKKGHGLLFNPIFTSF